MGRKSTIKGLPELVVKQLDREIARDRKTLDELLDWLVKEHGAGISRSTLHRHAVNVKEVTQRMTEVRQMASAIATEVGDLADDQTMQMLIQGMQSIMFRISMQAQQDDGMVLDPKDMHFMARALKDLGSAQKQTVDLKAKIREDIRAEAVAILDEAENSAREAGEKGLSKEAVAKLRRDFLGVRDDR
tara:strand:+ start:14174 stop:14737 length:564 start_codon:yes stop_codon:yes gene_type:complete